MRKKSAYAVAGVNIDAGEEFVQLIRQRIKKAWPGADKQIGGFAGGFELRHGRNTGMACTDGSGTVAILCALTERFDVIGQNAAAMSLVDAYVAGSVPVALLDVLDVAKLDPERHIGVIDGLIAGCKMAGQQCRLIGGETAELPDMFKSNWMVNVNTTAIGDPSSALITKDVRAGQLVLGWPSNGFGSNGFSLLRKIFQLKGSPSATLRRLNRVWSELREPLVDALLQPAPIWIGKAEEYRREGARFAAHAHITGGGLVDNIPRILPSKLKVVINRADIRRPPIFALTQRLGNVSEQEMNRVLNQGIMMVSVLDTKGKQPSDELAPIVGTVEKRTGNEPQVELVGTFHQ
jgi:phosphoribosylformylglycinamidine cyclo-ligase